MTNGIVGGEKSQLFVILAFKLLQLKKVKMVCTSKYINIDTRASIETNR